MPITTLYPRLPKPLQRARSASLSEVFHFRSLRATVPGGCDWPVHYLQFEGVGQFGCACQIQSRALIHVT